MQCLRVVKEVVIKFMNREAIATALFDTRSSYLEEASLRKRLEQHGSICRSP